MLSRALSLLSRLGKDDVILPSTNRLLQRLERDLAGRKPTRSTAVLVVSLGRSDSVEAALGAASSAAVQGQIMERMQLALRMQDYMTAASPDEVWIVLPDLASPSIANLAARHIARALQAPVAAGGMVAMVRPCVGIAFADDSQKRGVDVLQAAVLAKNQALRLNQRQFCAGTTESNYLGKDLIEAVDSALKRNALFLTYQPIVDASTRRLLGVEALVRWPEDTEPALTTPHLIALAEESGLIQELTRFVLHTALRDYVSHCAALGIRKIWINLSAKMLSDPGLPDFLQQALDVWSTEPDVLGLEVTESSLITDVEQSVETLKQLAHSGFELAIDDFGTGYSSLAYLRRFPINELKIDKLFVQHMTNSIPDSQIVGTIISLAHHFKLRVVAEGVESEAVLAELQRMGCDQAQGYLFARPMRVGELAGWLRDFARQQEEAASSPP